ADSSGKVVHLHERECSLQRRFQKIVEEAPAALLPRYDRDAMCAAAVGIARAARYTNAGTVEFIYGGGKFYFLEMNTRLQVEHPVTEAITGIDLVAEQFRIAGGAPLGRAQADIAENGHAIECRLYAEDADRDFAPCTGSVLRWRPPHGDRIRVDAGIEEGSIVTSAFDPLLAKLVLHAGNRDTAVAAAIGALADTVLLGCGSNIGFLRRLLSLPAVRQGALHTGLMAEEMAALRAPPLTAAVMQAAVAAAAMHASEVRRAADAVPALHAAIGHWRN
ncbi:MAG TPA: 3-methylcrotonyl-CoA carboxylase, partial [Acetobacteraceae bacterium]|nr:3-methylcrotonyl-CoA carboxylase [Acetobacteraceae bacterium]